MHSREPDFIDARALVDGYIRFGDSTNAIPEFARPAIISVVAEVLSLARKQEYETISAIADICAQTPSKSPASFEIAELCQSRLDELSGTMGHETRVNAVAGRAPMSQLPAPRQIESRTATRRMTE